jgi:hypothetical protein
MRRKGPIRTTPPNRNCRRCADVLIYGDPAFQLTLEEAARGLRRFARAAEQGGLGEGRALLVAAGQLEQGVADAGVDWPAAEVTNEAARIFLARLHGHTTKISFFRSLPATDPIPLRIKIPEGTAFYCLYPDQYFEAAKRWCQGRSPGRILVIGVRSIGTSLSAVVGETLRARGFEVDRITVRPRGHPFERTVELPALTHNEAIVVDEGPGKSGSSMASVVKALGHSRVTLFPGHHGEPGEAASEEVRQIWLKTPRIVESHLLQVVERLRAASEEILSTAELECIDLGAGGWRKQFRWPGEPPFVAPNFERTKFLFRTSGGDGLLWKFAGFGATDGFQSIAGGALEIQSKVARQGWTLAPVREVEGFIATPWIRGRPLAPADLSDSLLNQLARYICDVARPSSPPDAFARLTEMTRVNTGVEIAEPTCDDLPGYGDGRLAPHEWIRSTDGRILKTDVWGHQFDHTCIGPQSILWDIASAAVEWRMTAIQTHRFLNAFARCGLSIAESDLEPYRQAWLAFQRGLR